MNPRVGEVGAHDGQFRFLRQNEVREVLQLADPNLHAGRVLLVEIEVGLDDVRRGRPFVVGGHVQEQPGGTGPAFRRHPLGAVIIAVECEQPRTVRAFPPKKARQAKRLVHQRAAHLEELHPGVREQGGQNPRMAGHVRGLGVARQRQPVLAGDGRRPAQRADQILRFEGLVVHRERERVDGEIARADGAGDPLTAVGRLFRPEDLAHRITRERPDELLLFRLIGVSVDGLEDFVGHLSAVLVANVAGQLRVADIKMRLIDDDDLLQRWAGRSRVGGQRA